MAGTAASAGKVADEDARGCSGTRLDKASAMTKLACLALLVSAACGKSGDKAAPAAPPVAIDVAGVNALVPADLKAKLVFDKTDVVQEMGHQKTTFTLAAPKSWKQDGTMFAKLKGGSDDGFMTQLSLASDCNGSCEPKDWAAAADKVVFKQFADAQVVKNEVTPTSRLLIATRDKTTFVAYAWWTAGASHYRYCTATLEEPVAAAAPAFAKACQAVTLSGDE
jgi:hypothetical protein